MSQLVVWDWNGTLLADSEACTDAGNHVITTFGGTPLPRNAYARVFDFPTLNFYCQQGADRDAMIAHDFVAIFHKHYEQRASRCRTRRGARKALHWLKENSIDSVILSNHIRSSIAQELQRLGIEECFAEILANEDTASTALGKNKIRRIHDYLTRMNYNPSHTVIVGDSPEDIGIGRELGIKTVGVTDGYFSTARLRASKPDFLIHCLTQLIEIVETGF